MLVRDLTSVTYALESLICGEHAPEYSKLLMNVMLVSFVYFLVLFLAGEADICAMVSPLISGQFSRSFTRRLQRQG